MIKPAIHSWGRIYDNDFKLMAKARPEIFEDMMRNRCALWLDCDDTDPAQEYLNEMFGWLENNITNFWYIHFKKDRNDNIVGRRYVLHFEKKADMVTFKTTFG